MSDVGSFLNRIAQGGSGAATATGADEFRRGLGVRGRRRGEARGPRDGEPDVTEEIRALLYESGVIDEREAERTGWTPGIASAVTVVRNASERARGRDPEQSRAPSGDYGDVMRGSGGSARRQEILNLLQQQLSTEGIDQYFNEEWERARQGRLSTADSSYRGQVAKSFLTHNFPARNRAQN